MIEYNPLFKELENTVIQNWIYELPELIKWNLRTERYAHIPQWKAILEDIPDLYPTHIDLTESVTAYGKKTDNLRDVLMQLHPWRKGPYYLYDIHIDAEWRSDWKWDRLIPHIKTLKNRVVLDIGCGNGYHTWRIAGAGAKLAIGIDPQPLFIYQYFAIKKLLKSNIPAWVLPMRLEDIPSSKEAFDTIFSMGVLYHRKSPCDHLKKIYQIMKPEGELILETLIIDNYFGEVLKPKDRYAKMKNVWLIPTLSKLEDWMRTVGFKKIKVVDINKTLISEQRSTSWMKYESLSDFLDPNDHKKTIEGYNAPIRIISKKNCHILKREETKLL